ncbi:hypothetical protein ABZ656_44545 [Streptomyces sp. NPDC007095]|uniref:hypothetical protein n=1 Tax=Streptomyces sp. NPDC007095 TaxID=3154482 RepID=UPI0033FF1C6F
MKDDGDLARRIERLRVVVERFGPIVEAGLSREWTEAVSEEPDWLAFRDLMSSMHDESSLVRIEDIAGLLECVGSLLDLWDEDPMGSTYYPYKAAELIELHCRMVTGNLPDDAPVGLNEWLDRFARHVDWQMVKGGMTLEAPHYFADLEVSLRTGQQQLDGAHADGFHTAMEASRQAADRYLEALRLALADPGGSQ